jgi:hypothetical protein
MEPNHLNFGGGVTETIVNPFILLAVLIAGVLMLTLRRQQAVRPFLVAALLISTDHVLLIGGLHFPMLRVLILFGAARIAWVKIKTKRPLFAGGINLIDIAFLSFAVFTALDGILLWRETAAVVFQMGNLYSALGAYLILRFFIRDQEDVQRAIRTLAFVTFVIALIMIDEQITGHNPYYALFGGAYSDKYSSVLVRDDHFRATGVFAHPILAGTFGGIMMPLFIGLWWKSPKDRRVAAMGALSATVLPFAASSSTALFGFIGGLIGLCFWPLRRNMRVVRWAILTVLVTLHLVMKAPVWHLISRIDLSGGSSSYHRYELVNQCILHFRDWFWVGTKNYADWGWDMWDLSNQYIGTADTAGIIPFLSFVGIIVFGFKFLGKARKIAARVSRKQELFIWAFAASLFANVVAFFGIGYFDQTVVAWYAIIVMIAAVSRSVKQEPGLATKEDSHQYSPSITDITYAPIENAHPSAHGV